MGKSKRIEIFIGNVPLLNVAVKKWIALQGAFGYNDYIFVEMNKKI